MGIEVVAVLLFAWFMELNQLLRDNAGILFFSSFFVILWTTGVITIVRRWAGE
jgi:hypothetical protein